MVKMAVDSLPDFSDMGNHLDRTGPHFISSVFRTYTREHPQYPPEHTNGVYLTTAEYFSPAMGPDQVGFYRDVLLKLQKPKRFEKQRVPKIGKTSPKSRTSGNGLCRSSLDSHLHQHGESTL